MSIIAKYKFDSSIYADLIPEFNTEFTDYNITDEVEGDIITRTIESDSLPTLMRLGSNLTTYIEGSELALLEVLDMNTSGLISCYRMFRYCTNLTSITCEWDTSNITDMSAMFASCSNLTTLDVSNFDTSNVTTMNSMFKDCESLTTLDVSNFNTSNVTNMQQMFYACNNLTTLDVSNFDTSNVTNMGSMFYNCNNLTTLDVSNFNTSNVIGMNYMFYQCNNLTTLDISKWNNDASKIEMFYGCTSLTTLDIANLSITDYGNNFFFGSNCPVKYIKTYNKDVINTIAPQLKYTRTADNQGVIITDTLEGITEETISALSSINWTVNTNPTLIAKYKYDSTIYKNLIPVFNEGYMGFIEDEEVDENGIVTRVIEHVELPTLMRFGEDEITERTRSLLEVLNLNTDELTDMSNLFMGCTKLTQIYSSNWNTSKVISIYNMCYRCNSLVSINTSNWNTSNIKNFHGAFASCQSLTNIDVTNWDVKSATTLAYMFDVCKNLTELDLSKWSILNNASLVQLVKGCESLKRLDISNFHIVSNGATNIFWGTISLTDIGMIYCDKETVNKVASLLSAEIHRTIWVESDDILQYDQYDHITYKTQKVQDTVHLNSPLLMGDTIEVIDGKTYHVHRYEKVVYDGSESWVVDGNTSTLIRFRTGIKNVSYSVTQGYNMDNSRSDKFVNYNNYSIDIDEERFYPYQTTLFIFIKSFKLSTPDVNGFKQWLSENPTTVIYELATPYYELISEEPLELTLLDTTDNTINNNSILPSNMTIANKELSTIAIKPSTTYTLAFDKSNEDSEVTIDICGSEQATTVLNRVELTTPSELGSGIRFISSDGCIVSNVRLLEGSLVEEAIPKETFEGLQNSFEDNLVTQEMVDSGEESSENLGKYKVEYKVTGKNKASDITPAKGNSNDNHWIVTDNNNGTYTVKNDGYTGSSQGFALKLHANVKPNTAYTFTYKVDGADWNEGTPILIYRDFYSLWDRTKFIIASQQTNTITFTTPSDVDKICIGFHYWNLSDGAERIISNIQLEEGTEATEYEPYKEGIKTYYLSSPLLEGDTIEDVNGVATHVKRYGKVVLDGSEDWIISTGTERTETLACMLTLLDYHTNTNSIYFCDKFTFLDIYLIDNEGIWLTNHNRVRMAINNSKLSSLDISGFKQWLSENPTTVVYELASPIYEPISTESILLDSYINGHLDLSNENIPIQKTEFRNFTKELAYLQPSTDYIVRFSSDNIGIAKVYLDSSVKEINVVQGINEVIITTPSTIVNNNIIIDGIGFNISDVQVIANAIEDGDIKDFDYFKGLQSSFEDGLVTDENDENYGKYKVECKIVGKNKFNVNNLVETNNTIFTYIDNGIRVKNKNAAIYSAISINLDVKPNTVYSISYKSNTILGFSMVDVYDENNKYFYGGYPLIFNTKNNNKIKVNFYCTKNTSVLGDVEYTNIQIEEGTQATEYEPYKESIYTLYLNSPLLKGDKLVIHEGKLCHYHKMGMVVLDGSEDEKWGINSAKTISYYTHSSIPNNTKIICNILPTRLIGNIYNDGLAGIGSTNTNEHKFGIGTMGITTVAEIRQWLQANPITVVYELAEPYYEPIEPQISQYSFSTVKEGDMEIITVLPIEIDLTYRTDINGVSSIEEQIASIQESTDISSIIDEEVDE